MPVFKSAKDWLTFLLGRNVDGDFKFKPLLMYHSENPTAFMGINKGTLSLILKSDSRLY